MSSSGWEVGKVFSPNQAFSSGPACKGSEVLGAQDCPEDLGGPPWAECSIRARLKGFSPGCPSTKYALEHGWKAGKKGC